MKRIIALLVFVFLATNGIVLSDNTVWFRNKLIAFYYLENANSPKPDGFSEQCFLDSKGGYLPNYEDFKSGKSSLLIGLERASSSMPIICFLRHDAMKPHCLHFDNEMLEDNSANYVIAFLKAVLCLIKRIDGRVKETQMCVATESRLRKVLFKKSQRDDSWVSWVKETKNERYSLISLLAHKLPY
ncbi:MAG: hypothetical protein KC505_03875 [Myxococcales bacterium]|nr:hypothetical protein [Myxococcales bacterium]